MNIGSHGIKLHVFLIYCMYSSKADYMYEAFLPNQFFIIIHLSNNSKEKAYMQELEYFVVFMIKHVKTVMFVFRTLA